MITVFGEHELAWATVIVHTGCAIGYCCFVSYQAEVVLRFCANFAMKIRMRAQKSAKFSKRNLRRNVERLLLGKTRNNSNLCRTLYISHVFFSDSTIKEVIIFESSKLT